MLHALSLQALGAARAAPTGRQPGGLSGTEILALLQALIAGLAVALSWQTLDVDARWRRSGVRPSADGMKGAAGLLLGAVGAAAVSALVSAVAQAVTGSGGPTPASAIFMLLSGFLLMGAVSALPASRLNGAQRTRVLIDGLMITAGAATFAWYFLLGPAITVHWRTPAEALVALGYPVMDVVLVGALLIVSAKSSRMAPLLWAPLAGGTAAMLIADCVREVSLQAGPNSLTGLVGPVRVVGVLCLAAAAVQMARFEDPSETVWARARRRARSDDDSRRENRHIWDSLLPYALVPAVAALAVYSWQRGLDSRIAAGVVAGTALLVMLTFLRQYLAANENHRLYQDATSAFEQSRAHAHSIEKLNQELQATRRQLQLNNTELAKANHLLHQQATTDPLTGLPNHRSMTVSLDRELERSGRYGRPCSLLFLDLDHFKALNDSCGHLAGDSALREMVTPISSGLRANDVAGRWGGEEFVVILPETEPIEAMSVAERLRALVGQHPFAPVAGGHLTCSIGVATFPYDASTRDALIGAADKAMYAAKRLGRDQVRSAVDPSVVAFLTEVRRGASREEASMWGIVEALTTIVAVHDADEDAESARVAELSMRVAMNLGLNNTEVRLIGLAGRLHDVGMVSVPPSIQSDEGPPGGEARLRFRAHASVGADIVGRVPSLSMLSPLIRAHHEQWSGAGYPDGLRGAEIPMGARIIGVCAAFCSLTHTHRDRVALYTAEAALREVESGSGTLFDPGVVRALRGTVEEARTPAEKAS